MHSRIVDAATVAVAAANAELSRVVVDAATAAEAATIAAALIYILAFNEPTVQINLEAAAIATALVRCRRWRGRCST